MRQIVLGYIISTALLKWSNKIKTQNENGNIREKKGQVSELELLNNGKYKLGSKHFYPRK